MAATTSSALGGRGRKHCGARLCRESGLRRWFLQVTELYHGLWVGDGDHLSPGVQRESLALGGCGFLRRTNRCVASSDDFEYGFFSHGCGDDDAWFQSSGKPGRSVTLPSSKSGITPNKPSTMVRDRTKGRAFYFRVQAAMKGSGVFCSPKPNTRISSYKSKKRFAFWKKPSCIGEL